VAPLRERREDIPQFLFFFLEQFSKQYSVKPPTLAPETLALLLEYSWPGNVRELKNIVERLVVRASDNDIEPRDLPLEVLRGSAAEQAATPAPTVTTAPARSNSDALFERMVNGGESFWAAVYAPFMLRDLTRDDVRGIVRRGLERTGGNYRVMVELFNMPADDYKRFLGMLRKYQCHMPFQEFRSASASRPGPREESGETQQIA
jgi:DNA-binding NtrC family response regulator